MAKHSEAPSRNLALNKEDEVDEDQYVDNLIRELNDLSIIFLKLIIFKLWEIP